MKEHFNKLTNAELERLAILAEECGEVIQVVNKIIRHGYDDWSPLDETKKTNRSRLESELGDLSFIVNFLKNRGDIDISVIRKRMDYKKNTINQWLRHNKVKVDEERN